MRILGIAALALLALTGCVREPDPVDGWYKFEYFVSDVRGSKHTYATLIATDNYAVVEERIGRRCHEADRYVGTKQKLLTEVRRREDGSRYISEVRFPDDWCK